MASECVVLSRAASCYCHTATCSTNCSKMFPSAGEYDEKFRSSFDPNINGLEIIQPLGRGAQGVIYKARYRGYFACVKIFDDVNQMQQELSMLEAA